MRQLIVVKEYQAADGVYDDIETTNLCLIKPFREHTADPVMYSQAGIHSSRCKLHALASRLCRQVSVPYQRPRIFSDSLGIPGSPSTLNSSLIFTQIYECGSDSSPVGNAGEEQLGSLIELVLETLLSNFQDVCNVRHAREIFHIM